MNPIDSVAIFLQVVSFTAYITLTVYSYKERKKERTKWAKEMDSLYEKIEKVREVDDILKRKLNRCAVCKKLIDLRK